MSEQWKDDLAAVGDTIESLRDELAAARAQVEKEALEMGGVIHDLRRELARTIDSFLVTQARAQAAEALAEKNAKAAAFAGKVLAESREYLADLDGAWLQDTATECGLLECVILPGSCGEDCRCDESAVSNEPRECYRFTDAGRAAIAEGEK